MGVILDADLKINEGALPPAQQLCQKRVHKPNYWGLGVGGAQKITAVLSWSTRSTDPHKDARWCRQPYLMIKSWVGPGYHPDALGLNIVYKNIVLWLSLASTTLRRLNLRNCDVHTILRFTSAYIGVFNKVLLVVTHEVRLARIIGHFFLDTSATLDAFLAKRSNHQETLLRRKDL